MFYWPHLVRLKLSVFWKSGGPQWAPFGMRTGVCPSARYKGFLGSAPIVTRLLHFDTKRGKRSASRPDRLTPRERNIVTHRTEGWVGTRFAPVDLEN